MDREFFRDKLLKVSDGIEDIGSPDPFLLFCLIFTYGLVYACIFNGIKSSGKVVYVTAPAPICLLVILMFKGLTLEGYETGLAYLFYPDIEKLKDINVWVISANQVIFQLGLGFGGNILFASYRKQNDRSYNSSVWIPLITVTCGLLCAVINFSFLGHLSKLINIPIDDLPLKGTDLAFITYPAAIGTLPSPNVWSAIFFCMLILLGIDSQFAYLEVLGYYLGKYYCIGVKKWIINLCLCSFSMFLGISMTCNGGFYIFNLIDANATLISLFVVLLFECIIISYYYGFGGISEQCANKTGATIPKYIDYSWKYVSPIVLFSFLVLAISDKFSETGRYKVIWPYILEIVIIMLPLSFIGYFMFKYPNREAIRDVQKEIEIEMSGSR